MRIKNAMNPQIEVVDPEASVRAAAEMMRDLETELLAVGTPKGLIGVLTDRDIAVRVTAAGLDAENTAVHRAMSLGVAACYEEQDLEEAIETMQKWDTGRLLVLDKHHRPVGVLLREHLGSRRQEHRKTASGNSAGSSARRRVRSLSKRTATFQGIRLSTSFQDE